MERGHPAGGADRARESGLPDLHLRFLRRAQGRRRRTWRLADYLAWARAAYPSATGASLLHTSVSFDLTVTSLWVPLTVGGDGADRRTVGRVVEVSLLEGDTRATSPPSTRSNAAPTGELVLGGEQLRGAAHRMAAHHPDVTIINSYGPSETTVSCTEFRVLPGDAVDDDVLPIGRPIRGMDVYVLDADSAPGAAGRAGGALRVRAWLGARVLGSARTDGIAIRCRSVHGRRDTDVSHR